MCELRVELAVPVRLTSSRLCRWWTCGSLWAGPAAAAAAGAGRAAGGPCGCVSRCTATRTPSPASPPPPPTTSWWAGRATAPASSGTSAGGCLSASCDATPPPSPPSASTIWRSVGRRRHRSADIPRAHTPWTALRSAALSILHYTVSALFYRIGQACSKRWTLV